MSVLGGKATGVELPKPVGPHMSVSLDLDAGTRATTLTDFPAGLQSYCGPVILFYNPTFPFYNGTVHPVPLHIGSNFLFFFFRGSQLRDCSDLIGNFGLKLTNNVRTVQNFGNSGDRQDAFCIMRWQ
jgi:hypothetical protein